MFTPHLNLNGSRGAGKSTISQLLASRHRTVWVPRVTTSPGIQTGEYERVGRQKFAKLRASGDLMVWTIHPTVVGRKIHKVAIPSLRNWPAMSSPDTDLIISVFGRYSFAIKEIYAPWMVNIFLAAQPEDIEKRLLARAGKKKGSNFSRHMSDNRFRFENNEIPDYDITVWNDGTPLQCVEKIEKILGLQPPKY